MLTAEEQPLLDGNDEAVWSFIKSDHVIVIDWRGTEEETLDEIMRFLPAASMTYELAYPGDDSVTVQIRFQDRSACLTLPFQEHNNFRVLLQARQLLLPDFDILLFRWTDGNDTHSFLLRPAAWWEKFRTTYPQRYQKLFRDINCLRDIWQLDHSTRSSPLEAKRLGDTWHMRAFLFLTGIFDRKRARQRRKKK